MALSLKDMGDDGDNTGLNNVRMKCTDIESFATYEVSGLGQTWGEWTSWESCPFRSALCGIRTRVEKHEDGADNTGMNEVEFACCAANTMPVTTVGTTAFSSSTASLCRNHVGTLTPK